MAKPHHHGDLREALIQAGIDILSERGLAALTLRACAARAGVSHAAPAHHFKGLPGLTAAICARGYRIFSDLMVAERDRAAPDAFARLSAICQGYLRFAREHPALFRLIFGTRVDFCEDADLIENAAIAYDILATGCAPFATDAASGKRLEITIWSLVHGYAGLMQNQPGKAVGDRDQALEFEAILRDLNLQMAD
jgi:AcrR family transcriptional regulator